MDKSNTYAEFEQLKFQLESKRSEIDKLKLDLNKSYFDIVGRRPIWCVQINPWEVGLVLHADTQF
jgi:HlyD family secretion protein